SSIPRESARSAMKRPIGWVNSACAGPWERFSPGWSVMECSQIWPTIPLSSSASVCFCSAGCLGGGKGMNQLSQLGNFKRLFHEATGPCFARLALGGAATGDNDHFDIGVLFGQQGGARQPIHPR